MEDDREMAGREEHTPSRKRRGNRVTIDWDTFNQAAVLAKPGWEGIPGPWTRLTCRFYIDWAHINRHFPRERHEIHIKSGTALIKFCGHPSFKKRLTEVALFLWGGLSKKDGTLSLCQMAYAEVFLGKDVDWNTFLNVKRNGVFPNRARHIPPNPAVALDDNVGNQEIAGAVAQVVATVNPAAVQAAFGRPAVVDAGNVVREGGPQDLDQPMLDQPRGGVGGPVGGEAAVDQELLHLREALAAMQVESEELRRRHEVELEDLQRHVRVLTDENAKLMVSNNELEERARALSAEEARGIDAIVEMATFGLVDPPADPPIGSSGRLQPRNIFGPAQFRGESSNAAAQATTQGGQATSLIARAIYDAMVARAEHAEAECARAKAQVDEQSRFIQVLRDTNTTMLLHNPAREAMLLDMSNMKLTSNLAMSEVEQMQREVRRVAAEFGDGGQRRFGLTSWPRVEEMFPDTLPTLRNSSSIDWNVDPNLQFQFNTARYRYADEGHNGANPLLWPNVADFVHNGSVCTMCQQAFGPEGGWTLGTCGHVYHPMCLMPHMVTRKRCASCRAPFHSRLYAMFGLQAYMPPHYEFDEENLSGFPNRSQWGRDMMWMWKWGHDNQHLPYQNVLQIPLGTDADVTEVCKMLIGSGDPGRRLYFGQLAGGHWDLERQVFVRQPHPQNLLFDSQGTPMGIGGEMDPDAQLAYIADTTFNEPQMLRSIIFHLHDRYDRDVVDLLRSLQSREELQNFLRNSIARGIVAPE